MAGIPNGTAWSYGATEDAIKQKLGSVTVPVDQHVNTEPVHDPTKNMDATVLNRMGAAIAAALLRLNIGNVAPFDFSVGDASAASQPATPLQRDGSVPEIVEVITPWAGSVVGISVNLPNGARTAGTLTAKWTKDGAAQTLSAVLDGGSTQTVSAQQAPGAEKFTAGQKIGLTWETDGSWAAPGSPPILQGTVWLALAKAGD